MRRITRRMLITLAVTCGLVAGAVTPANAHTSLIVYKWNQKDVAWAWYNSGTHNPSKGRNSFTLRGDKGIIYASVHWAFFSPDDIWDYEIVFPTPTSAAEKSFSAYKTARNPAIKIYYKLCIKATAASQELCSSIKQDWVR
ncbi:hypothetical protein Aph01nite_67760 [Acrocarpospora phusangensis]|uniref:Tat pathway signal sequence domain protein n=1 Tax=Acrocarpospora phusangensis TaxID=1070424 RepID=A0A919QGM6_9ACTN|nr:hypothetical protein [Acrocarpospora phusangensis]GIH28466.1 hypothetical protein Aph01nite_67760 [Acrocarpospora phusangensis]